MKKTGLNRFAGFSWAVALALTVSSPAAAWGRFGGSIGGPIAVHASTNGGVGVSLPTPQASVGVGGPADVTVTATPYGVSAGASGPYEVSGGVSSDGGAYVGATEYLPGGGAVSGRVDQNGVSGDAGVEIPIDRSYYSGI